MASGVSVEIDWFCDGHVDGDQGLQRRSIVRAKRMLWKSFGSLTARPTACPGRAVDSGTFGAMSASRNHDSRTHSRRWRFQERGLA